MSYFISLVHVHIGFHSTLNLTFLSHSTWMVMQINTYSICFLDSLGLFPVFLIWLVWPVTLLFILGNAMKNDNWFCTLFTVIKRFSHVSVQIIFFLRSYYNCCSLLFYGVSLFTFRLHKHLRIVHHCDNKGTAIWHPISRGITTQ